jgi:poly(A) polymerase
MLRAMKRLFKAFEEAGKELYLVGGAVRDLALGIDMSALDDLDFCTNARPEETLRILEDGGFNTYDMGFEFGTVGCVLHGPESGGYPKDCQVTTYRSEEYYRRGSRHPVVKFGDTIQQDLGRRDFSINSIALDARGDYVDPYDGLGDLKRGVLRVIGDPIETLAEDPLRILRVGRFVAKLGFEVDAALYEAARHRADHILEISHERWLQEMRKLLCGDWVRPALRFLQDVRILGIILPEVASLVGLHERLPDDTEHAHKDVWAHTLQVIEQTPAEPTLRWAALFHDMGKAWTRLLHTDGRVTFYRHEKQGAMLFEGIARRFTFDNASTKEIRFIIENHGRVPQYASEWSDAAVRRLVQDLDPYVDSLLRFARADLTTRFPEKRKAALARIDELEARIRALEEARSLRPELPSGIGNDLMKAFDLKPSPLIGDLKSTLEERIIEGALESGRPSSYYVAHLKKNPPDFLESEATTE